MCILVLKEKGIKYPSLEVVKNCLQANPDGFSIAWNCEGDIKTFKTMDAKEFMQKYRDIISSYDYNDTAMMLHARIATHGSKKIDNCHCWVGNLLGIDTAFAHNGILNIKNRADMTDSETFLRDYLEKGQTMSEVINAITKYIGASKFGFLDGLGNVSHFGRFENYKGALFSNPSYRRYSFISSDPRLWAAM